MKKLLALFLCLAMLLGCAAVHAEAVDGEYTGVSRGFYGDLNVTMTIREGRIADIRVENCPETPELGGKAIEIMTAAMISG